MPIINIIFDDQKVSNKEIVNLSKSIQKIVQDETLIKEVFVYADSPKIKVDVAPIEIFIEMSVRKIKNKEELIQNIKNKLSEWKKSNNFKTSISITLMPMNWIFETNI